MPKVVIICPVHQADDVRVYVRETIALLSAGFEVVLLAGKNPATDIAQKRLTLQVIPWHGSRWRRLANWPKFFRRAYSERADVYILHNPDSLLIGFALKIVGKHVVYDSHEDFSRRLATRDWIPRIARRPLGSLVSSAERCAVALFDGVVFTQEAQVRRYQNRPALIRNLPVTDSPAAQTARNLAKVLVDEATNRLVYVGGIHHSRGLNTMLNLITDLNGPLAARLWLIGSMSDEVAATAKGHDGWQYVDYLGELPQDKAFAHMVRAQLGLIFLSDVADYAQTSPNKLYEYMQFGLPFLATNFPKWHAELDGVEAGRFVDSEDREGVFVQAMEMFQSAGLLTKLGDNGQRFVNDQWNWSEESGKFLAVVEQAIKKKAQR